MANERGFTLLETMVALVIMALGIGALGRLVSTGLAVSEQAESLATATQLARSTLARSGADETLAEGVTEGFVEGGYRWRRVVQFHLPDPETPPTGFVPAQVEVTVGKGPHHPAVTLTSLRLVPQ